MEFEQIPFLKKWANKLILLTVLVFILNSCAQPSAQAPQELNFTSYKAVVYASGMSGPAGLAMSSTGTLYVADYVANNIRIIAPDLAITTTAAGTGPWGLTLVNGTDYSKTNGNSVYVTSPGSHTIMKLTNNSSIVYAGISGASGLVNSTLTSSRFDTPFSIKYYNGKFYVADIANHVIRELTPAGNVATYAGTSGAAGSATGGVGAGKLNIPWDLVFDSQGNMFISSAFGNYIQKADRTGFLTLFAGNGQDAYIDGTGTNASLMFPSGLAIDSSDNIYVLQYGTNSIRKITPQGVVTTLQITNSNLLDLHMGGIAIDTRFTPNLIYVSSGTNIVQLIPQL